MRTSRPIRMSGAGPSCAVAIPLAESVAGLYRVEVWDATVTTLHAAGEYRLAAT